MAILSRANQYRGVNAHFNSRAQNEPDGWKSFHTRYIVALGDLIDANLPSGYELSWETSLQIREYDPNTGDPLSRPRKPEPDITVWQTQADAEGTPALASSEATPTLVKPAVEMLSQNPEHYYTAVVIYERHAGERVPVARIELLSPSNKPGGTNAGEYIAKQDMAIRAGRATLVIIDFLHQTESPIPGMPSYPRQQSGAFPYTITVINPRPTLEEGEAQIYGFRVDDPIPAIDIPLTGQDVVRADFNTAYQDAFRASSSFSNRADYSQQPDAFETYSPQDQQAILRRMQIVQQAVERGVDLEQAPL